MLANQMLPEKKWPRKIPVMGINEEVTPI